LQIVVLGKSPAWQDSGGACSGYLIREGDFTLLLDCGNGVFSNLRRTCDYVDVDAVVITPLHADHFLDLVPFSYALIYAPRQQPVAVGGFPGTTKPARPLLHVPPGAREMFRRVVGSWGPECLIEDAFDMHEYNGPEELDVGPLRLRFCEVPHYTRTFATELTAPDGHRFTFSADCSPTDELVQFASGTDLLLIEGTLPRPERTGLRGHLTPREAGEHGRRAHAKRVVITHFSDELDPDWVRAEATAGFDAAVELASEGAEFAV
jgi:ribonuclease BN (tRNA processing enzyme)